MFHALNSIASIYRDVAVLQNNAEDSVGLIMIDDIIMDGLSTYANEKLYPEEWDFAGLLGQMEQYFVPKTEIHPQI